MQPASASLFANTMRTPAPISRDGMAASLSYQDNAANLISMASMKASNQKAQLLAMQDLLDDRTRPELAVIDLGAGEGKNAPLWKLAERCKNRIRLFAVDTRKDYEQPYRLAHGAQEKSESGKIDVIDYFTGGMERLRKSDIEAHFPALVDVIFSSHSMYYALEPMRRANDALRDTNDRSQLDAYFSAHPMTALIDSLSSGGVMVVTLSAAQELGAQLRFIQQVQQNKVNGFQGPYAPDTQADLVEFMNMHTWIKLFDDFKLLYEQERNCTLEIISFPTVTRVETGYYKADLNTQTGLWELRNPTGRDDDPNWKAPAAINALIKGWPTREQALQMTDGQRQLAREKQELFLKLKDLHQVRNHFCQHDQTLSIKKLNHQPIGETLFG